MPIAPRLSAPRFTTALSILSICFVGWIALRQSSQAHGAPTDLSEIARGIEEGQAQLRGDLMRLVLQDFRSRLTPEGAWASALREQPTLLDELGERHIGTVLERIPGSGDAYEYRCRADFIEDTVDEPGAPIDEVLASVRLVDLSIHLMVHKSSVTQSPMAKVHALGGRLDREATSILQDYLLSTQPDLHLPNAFE